MSKRYLYILVAVSFLGLLVVGYFLVFILSSSNKPQEIFLNKEGKIDNKVGTSTHGIQSVQQPIFTSNSVPLPTHKNGEVNTTKNTNSPTVQKLNWFFTKDESRIYFMGQPINVDFVTFQVIGSNYAKDRNTIYSVVLHGDDEAKFVKTEFDPKTFEVLPGSRGIDYSEFSKDANGVYFQLEKIPGADTQTFSYLGADRYYKDKNYLYYQQSDSKDGFSRWVIRIDSSDPATARVVEVESMVIDDPYTFHRSSQMVKFVRDKNTAYYQEMRVVGIDPESFDPGNFSFYYYKSTDGYFIYNGNVYFVDSPYPGLIRTLVQVKDADTITFLGLVNLYARDKNYAYYRGGVIYSADTTTFTILDNSVYAKDSRQVYLEGSVLPEADATTFEVLKFGVTNNSLYAKDKNHVFYKNHIVQDGDRNTFVVIDSDLGRYAKDKIHIFYGGGILNGVDMGTFTMLKFFAKDKNHIYFTGKILDMADPVTFQEIENTPIGSNPYDTYDAMDKSFRYKVDGMALNVVATPK